MYQPIATDAERLAYLYRIAGIFNATLDLDQVLNLVMDEVVAVTGAERGFIVLRLADGRLEFKAARGIEQNTIDNPELKISHSVIERVLAQGQPQLTLDASKDNYLADRESVVLLGLRSVLCVPLVQRAEVKGVIYVDNRVRANLFTRADLELLSGISTSAVNAIENARLYLLALEQGRIAHELKLAREVQASLMPHEQPEAAGWQFAGAWLPAREVAGDYYDFIPLAGSSEAHLGLVIADVSDKGMPSALYMALARSTIRASVSQASSPAAAMEHANRLLCADSASGMFVSVFYGDLNLATGEVVYVNAGHNPPLWRHSSDGSLSELATGNLVMGVDDTCAYTQHRLLLAPGDVLFIYTDGLTDAPDQAMQEYGLERVKDYLAVACELPARDACAGLLNQVRRYSGDAHFDDISLILVKREEA